MERGKAPKSFATGRIPESGKRGWTFKLLMGVVVPILIAVGLAGFFFWQWQRTRRPVTQPQEEIAASVEGVTDEESEATPAADSAEPEASAYSFAVRNGAGISGLASRFSREITTQIEGATIVETSNAEATSFEESVLVSFIEDTVEAERVARLLGVSLGNLPPGESEPEADFLVIVGGAESTQE